MLNPALSRGHLPTFVLVSGAWHGGWCWERVKPLLEAAGHRVLAPDLLGMGSDPTPLAAVSLGAWADQVASLVQGEAEPVVLVGHSRGGIVISEVAERVPKQLKMLVYLAAVLARAGETLAQATAKFPHEPLLHMLIDRADGTTVINPEAAGGIFYNTTEPRWLARANALVGPEPMSVFSTPLRLSDEAFGSVPRAYVECALDVAVPLGRQRAMQKDLPCAPVITLETDHSPFYSAPELLASALIQLAMTE